MFKYSKKIKSQESTLYNKILFLSRNKLFYTKLNLNDTFQNRINLIFLHISFIFIKIKKKNENLHHKEFYQKTFDLIFADAWPGKYSEIDEVLDLIKVGGFYIVDDMTKQPNWPEGHEENVKSLVAYLEKREDLTLTKLNWSTGVIMAVKN